MLYKQTHGGRGCNNTQLECQVISCQTDSLIILNNCASFMFLIHHLHQYSCKRLYAIHVAEIKTILCSMNGINPVSLAIHKLLRTEIRKNLLFSKVPL